MSENETPTPTEILNVLLDVLRQGSDEQRLQAIQRLETLNYSSEAIRAELEQVALHAANTDLRSAALNALNFAAHQNIRARVSKISRAERATILAEIAHWEQSQLIEKQNADVLRARYNFDMRQAAARVEPTPQPAPEPAPAARQDSTPEDKQPATLAETLLSENTIRIALYLGAFFVISSAAILAAIVEVIRMPILILGTLVFGGISVLIRKRLPQPSFALFIVFSFLLPITANVLEEALNLSARMGSAYWAVIAFFMALIWAGGTWLYNSRLFSVTAFIALAVSFLRINGIFEAEPEVVFAVTNIAALAGLGGTFALKKWKDEKFALPLFIAAQILQGLLLFAAAIIFINRVFDLSTHAPLWHLISIFTWTAALVFYILSERLYRFALFPWLAAATLLAFPWLVAAAFDLKTFGWAATFFIWGVLAAFASEGLNYFEITRKYSLPVLAVSIPLAAGGVITAFVEDILPGFMFALASFAVYGLLHFLRPRQWLWLLNQVNFITAYFAFFNLPAVQGVEIFTGYKLLVLSLLYLFPDLFFKNDSPETAVKARVAPVILRIFGVGFTIIATLIYVFGGAQEYLETAVLFGLFAVFFMIYTAVKRIAWLGYIPAAYIPLAAIFGLRSLDIDGWLPALTVLAILYYLSRVIFRGYSTWAVMLRSSALALGTLTAFAALILDNSAGSWWAPLIGLLFAAEMYLSRNGWFESGIPVIFTVGAFMILKHTEVVEPAWHLLTYSLVWLLTDLIAHLTFPNPRPVKWIVRTIGGLFALANYIVLPVADVKIAVIGFGIYTLLFLGLSLLYRQPNLIYAFTGTLPLFVIFLLRYFEIERWWPHPVILLAVGYYFAGGLMRRSGKFNGWDVSMLYSGLGLGALVSFAAPGIGRLDAALPVAIAAGLWTAEAFLKRNAWLALPANLLYLLAYFIILNELDVDQPQFYSMGAALLGMVQHYLLTRADSRAGAFIMGMLSQLVLLGTTYIQMLNTEELIYFFVLFLQSLAVIAYGVIIRSRSLTFVPIGIVVLGIFTVLYSALKGISAVILIGCAGVLLLTLGIAAVILRERIVNLGRRLSDWKA